MRRRASAGLALRPSGAGPAATVGGSPATRRRARAAAVALAALTAAVDALAVAADPTTPAGRLEGAAAVDVVRRGAGVGGAVVRDRGPGGPGRGGRRVVGAGWCPVDHHLGRRPGAPDARAGGGVGGVGAGVPRRPARHRGSRRWPGRCRWRPPRRSPRRRTPTTRRTAMAAPGRPSAGRSSCSSSPAVAGLPVPGADPPLGRGAPTRPRTTAGTAKPPSGSS